MVLTALHHNRYGRWRAGGWRCHKCRIGIPFRCVLATGADHVVGQLPHRWFNNHLRCTIIVIVATAAVIIVVGRICCWCCCRCCCRRRYEIFGHLCAVRVWASVCPRCRPFCVCQRLINKLKRRYVCMCCCVETVCVVSRSRETAFTGLRVDCWTCLRILSAAAVDLRLQLCINFKLKFYFALFL